MNKSPLLYLLIFLLFIDSASTSSTSAPVIFENTTRSGNINGNELWKGVINVTGDVIIHSGALVNIEPGTFVLFAASSDDQFQGPDVPITDSYFPNDPAVSPSKMSAILVYGGTLYAVGTPDQSITFTSSAQNPKPGDWHSIQYAKVGSKLVVQHSIIEYGYYGIQIDDTTDDSNLILKNNTIRHIVACGICCGYDPERPVTVTILDNDISYCGHEGIDAHENANLVVERNVFHDNLNLKDGPSGAGIVIDNNNSIIKNNQFLRNRFGINIISPNSYPVINNNIFSGNVAECFGYCPIPLQTSCFFTISPANYTHSSIGGTSSVSVSASSTSCVWTASESLDWVTLSPSSGTGSGTVKITATANTGATRFGSVLIAGQTYIISQAVATIIATPNEIYRFFNTTTGTHFYTSSFEEMNSVLNTLPQFYYEGVAFSGASSTSSVDVSPVYRFFNTQTGTHFYTISNTEKDYILSNLSNFSFEGEAYSAHTTNSAGTKPLHRFFNTQTGTHFYTTSDAEKANVQNTLPQYNYEGIAYYVE